MIKVHAFYCFNSINWATFIFQHQDGTCYTFNSNCWEDGKPVLRKVAKLHYDIMGIRLALGHDGWDNASVLNIVLNDDEEFETFVHEYREYVAYGDYYLGVTDKPNMSRAVAVGSERGLRGWATRGLNFGRPHSVRDVFVSLKKTGMHVGRTSGSNIAYPEEFGWVLDYSTGKLIKGCGTKNQLVTSS